MPPNTEIIVSEMKNLVPVAVEGMRNVINATADLGVDRVVFTSSYGAVTAEDKEENGDGEGVAGGEQDEASLRQKCPLEMNK
ncbi:hypothetical protein E2562_018532 [Oryza meyeriana var. granulata]|uniref:3-beta hydroxysteroid dehydrogenase/isomerase domain-containing protein n=1 Tax=Oryza meyeriana var. granulata TaxID=110450 RepID=A0A6G1F9B2_9ORYZ|nr:hypothetical protein E2562_018532 [Oryza meyeriana var. granulata]